MAKVPEIYTQCDEQKGHYQGTFKVEVISQESPSWNLTTEFTKIPDDVKVFYPVSFYSANSDQIGLRF